MTIDGHFHLVQGYRQGDGRTNLLSQLSCADIVVVPTTGQGNNPDRGGCVGLVARIGRWRREVDGIGGRPHS